MILLRLLIIMLLMRGWMVVALAIHVISVMSMTAITSIVVRVTPVLVIPMVGLVHAVGIATIGISSVLRT